MKKLSIAAYLFGLIPLLFGVDIFDYPVSGSTDSVEAVLQQLAEHPVIVSEFSQRKHIGKISKTFTSSGVFAYHRDLGLLWDIEKPVAMVQIIGEDGFTQRLPSGKVIVMSAGENPTFDRFSRIFRSILEGNMEVIQEDFYIFFHTGNDDSVSETAAWTIGLQPKDVSVQALIHGIILSGSTDLSGLTLLETGGDSVVYDFSQIRYPSELREEIREKFINEE